MLKQITLALAAVLSVSLATAKESSPSPDPELAGITARGRTLAEYDTAAWHSTDAVRAMKPEKGSVGRYIAEKTGAKWVFAYGRFNDKHDRFLIVYEATQGVSLQNFTVKKYDPPLEDAGFYYRGAIAIDTALKDFQGEKRPHNAAVLPAESHQIYVYIVPAQTAEGVYPLGGDVRYLISPDGSRIIEKRQLHQTILEFKDTGKPMGTADAWHTHTLSDVPEDTDVFHVLTRRPLVPEQVKTQNHLYEIQVDGTIKRLK